MKHKLSDVALAQGSRQCEQIECGSAVRRPKLEIERAAAVPDQVTFKVPTASPGAILPEEFRMIALAVPVANVDCSPGVPIEDIPDEA